MKGYKRHKLAKRVCTVLLSMSMLVNSTGIAVYAQTDIENGSFEESGEVLSDNTEDTELVSEGETSVPEEAVKEDDVEAAEENTEDEDRNDLTAEEKESEEEPDKEDGASISENVPAEDEENTGSEEDSIAEKEDEESSEEEAEDYPAFEETVRIDGVKITVSAEEGVFPEDASLSVKKVTSTQEKKAKEAVEEERDEDHTVAVSYTYDIKVLDADGEEIQPADESKVKVSFCMDEAEDDNLTANVYHITEENDGELVAEKLETETEGDTVIAETDGFSLYTVEFTYEEKQYVLQGNSEVELTEILKAVGLSGDVTKVTVSDSTLFSAEKDTDGAWIVAAHKAFSSEEWMKVTINGVAYEIIVTDEIDYDGSKDINFTDVDCPEGLSIDNDCQSDEIGYYYVNMPSGKYPNPKTVTILDGFTSSFKVYDDGGKNNNYTIYSNSGFYHKIILKAPQGYKLQLTGMVQVYENPGRRAWLEVYDGTSENDSNRLGNEAYGNKTTSGENIGTLISEGENVTLVFRGYTDNISRAGLNLTVSLIKDQNYNDITIDSVTGGSVVSNMESAKLHDVVTLTAIPTDDSYMLNSISVKDAEDNNIPLSNDMHWYSGTNTATFSMPGKAVTVTPVFTNNQTATEGGLIIAMPKNGNIDATHIPSSVQSFKVLYEYPNTAITGTSVLKLTVPDGYTMKLSGTAEFGLKYEREDNNQTSKFYVYDGENDSTGKLIDFSTTSSVDNNFSAIFSTGRSIYIYCESFQDTYWNLDLTITLVPGIDHSVFISSDVIHGKVVSDKEVAKFHETVTLMVKPDEGYVLQSIEVTDDDGTVSMTPSSADVVFGDVNYYVSNEITFKMRSSDATVNATFMPKTDFYVNMPKTGQRDITIPVDMTSFKLYDSGGKSSGYGKGENGKLLLTAPDGYVMNIKGSGTIRYYKEGIYASSVLCIFDGNSNSSEKIGEYIHTRQYQTDVDESSVFSVDKTSSGHQMLIHFETPSGGMYSYSNDNFEFTVTLKKLLTNGITIQTIADQIYTGNAITPAITVMDGETDITSQCDFAYSNNTEAGTATVTITAKNTSTEYAGSTTATFNIVNEPVFNNHALLLTGQVGVQFFLELPAGKTSADYAGSYVTFSGQGINSSTHYDIPASTAVINGVDTEKYLFTVNITSIQMADKITPTFHYIENGQEKTVVGAAYSAEDYIKWAVTDNHVTGKNLDIVNALADYGHYAQIYLSQQNGWVIGTDHAEMKTYTTNSYNYNGVYFQVDNSAILCSTGDPVASVNYRLYFDDTLSLCVALTPENGKTIDEVNVEDAVITPTKSGDQYLIMIPDISATQLSYRYHMSVGATQVQVSAMSYVYGILNSETSSSAAKDLVCALYYYGKACK